MLSRSKQTCEGSMPARAMSTHTTSVVGSMPSMTKRARSVNSAIRVVTSMPVRGNSAAMTARARSRYRPRTMELTFGCPVSGLHSLASWVAKKGSESTCTCSP